MTEHQSSRTLVKSVPELWAECSDAASLARHLGAFGEIRITKLEPETAVAWEGTAASGTVKLESSGWGTRVTLTVKEEAPPRKAGPEAVEPAPEPVAPEPEPVAVEPEPEQVAVEAEPEPVEPEPAPVAPELVAPAPRAGMFARFRLAFRRKPAAAEPAIEAPPEPEPVALAAPDREPLAAPDPEPLAAPGPEPLAAPDLEPIAEPERPPLTGEEALVAALDSLGRAHHRPYSRA